MNDETPGSLTSVHRAAETEIPDSWLMAQPEQDAFELYEHREAAVAAPTIRDPRLGAGPKFLAPTAAFAPGHGIASTPDRFAIPAVQDDTQVFRAAFVACAVFAALGLGWNSGLDWNSFFGVGSVSVQQDVRSAQALASAGEDVRAVKGDRAATASAPNNRKITTTTARGSGPGPDSSQAPPPSTVSKSPAVARVNVVSSGSAQTAVEHGAKIISRPTQMPETKPITIEGWTVREVVGGTAVLEGPGGIWTAKRGDTVPGVGKIDSIVRWGNRWIVATSRGIISTQ
jgi:hypothetical protein